MQSIQCSLDRRIRCEKQKSLIYGHPQNICDVFIAVDYFESPGIEAGTFACRAWGVDAGQKQKLNTDKAFTATGFAASFCHIEREAAGIVFSCLGHLCVGKQCSHMVEQSCVR